MKEPIIPYKNIRHMMKSGDIIEWQSESLIGVAIRLFTKKDVNHTSTVIRTTELGSDRVFVNEALSKGIEMHSLSKRIKKHKGRVYWLQIRSQYDSARYGIRKWAVDHIEEDDVGYDYGSIIKQTVGKVSADAKNFFCSEFSFMALRDGGKIDILQGIEIAPRPGEFADFGIFYGRMRIK